MTRRYLFCAAAGAALSLLASPAALAAGEGHARALHEHYDITFHQDSSYEEIVDFTWRAVDQQGVTALGQQYLYFEPGRQTLEVLTAETLPAYGTAVAVPASDIKMQDGVLGGISYPDKKLLQISFPKLGAGDAIHLRYRRAQKVTELPGGASRIYYFDRNAIREDSSVAVHFPAELALQHIANEMTPLEDKTVDGQRSMRWDFRSIDTGGTEVGSVNAWKQTPYLMLSTFADWKAIADGYEQGVGPKAVVTDEVSALAADIVKGATDQREEAERIYNWVRKNIRYLASYVGAGGFVPNDVHTILQKRYGDCKDHALLLETLLTARGIAASQVLIPSDTDTYDLPAVPVLWFNHAINYLPGLNIYLDSTNDLAPFGVLPEQDQDKPVLVTKNFVDVARTPAASFDSLKIERRVRIQLATDGSATRTTEIKGRGQAAMLIRTFLDSIGPGKQQDWVKQLFSNRANSGSGSLEELKPNDGTVGYRLEEHIVNYVAQPEASSLRFSVGYEGPINIDGIFSRYVQQAHHYDFQCGAFGLDDQIDIVMPPQLQVLYMPKDVSLKEDPIVFNAHYERLGDTYRLTRLWGSRSPSASCMSYDYGHWHEAMQRIQKALRGSLLFVEKIQQAKLDDQPGSKPRTP